MVPGAILRGLEGVASVDECRSPSEGVEALRSQISKSKSEVRIRASADPDPPALFVAIHTSEFTLS